MPWIVPPRFLTHVIHPGTEDAYREGMAERWAELKRLFHEAVTQPASGRAQFLAEVRQHHPELADELVQLLASDEAANAFLESPPLVAERGTAAPALAPGSRLGGYEILDRIGSGGMGEVYRARDPRLQRDVAVKVLPPHATSAEWRARFEREARTAAALSHPNIATIYEIGEAENRVYFAMELIDGVTLAERVRDGARPLGEVLDIAIPIADALSEAARKGIVHRDLKTANVMVTARGMVKVLDFGLAKFLDHPDAMTQLELTQAGAVMGTLPYMSPEQILGRPVDTRSDLFALGVMLYELAAGRRPFTGATSGELAGAILHQSLPSLPRDAGALTAIVTRLLEKDPADRYASADELLTDLKALRAQQSNVMVARPRPATIRRLTLPLLSALLAAAIAVVAWVRAGDGDGAGASPMPSLVMLPADVTAGPEHAFLADAIPASMSGYLAAVPHIETKVPPSQTEVARAQHDIRRIAAAYDVANCVLSSVVVRSGEVLLNVRLVDARDKRVWWSGEYRGTLENYLQPARHAAEGIRQAFARDTPGVVLPEAPTLTPAAEQAFRHGEHYLKAFIELARAEDFDIAGASLERAWGIEPAPQIAAALARLHISRADTTDGKSLLDALETSKRWAQHSLERDPQSGRAWAALAAAETRKAAANLRLMLEHGLRAALFGKRCDECHNALSMALLPHSATLSLETMHIARAIDPLATIAMGNTANVLIYFGRAPEALTLIDSAVAMEPSSPGLLLQKGLVLVELGRVSEAAALLRKITESARQGEWFETTLLTVQHGILRTTGDDARADAAVRKILEFARRPQTGMWTVLAFQLEVVPVLARSRKIDAAIQLLTVGAARDILPPLDWFVLNPHLAPLHADPRAARLVQLAAERFEETHMLFEQARARGEMPPYLEQPYQRLLTDVAPARARAAASAGNR